MMRPDQTQRPVVWVEHTDITGNQNNLVALAKTLDPDFVAPVDPVDYLFGLQGGVRPSPPDIFITTTVFPHKYSVKRIEGYFRAYTVYLAMPDFPGVSSDHDLNLSYAWDVRSQDVSKYLTVPSRFDPIPSFLDQKAIDYWSRRLALKKQIVGFCIGDIPAARVVMQMAEEIYHAFGENAQFVATVSRRTSRGVTSELKCLTKGSSFFIYDPHNAEGIPNILPYILYRSALVVVPDASMSMTTDAIAAGRPLLVSTDYQSEIHKRYVEHLERLGLCATTVKDAMAKFGPPNPYNSAPAMARDVLAAYAKFRALNPRANLG